MDFSNFFFQLVISVSLFLVGFKIYHSSNKHQSSKYFFGLSISTALWTICNYFANSYSPYSTILNNLTFLFGLSSVLFLFLFALNYPNDFKNKSIEIISMIPIVIIEFFLLFTKSIVISTIPVDIGTDIIRGPLFNVYTVIIIFYAVLAIFVFIWKLIYCPKDERNKIRAFVVTMSLTVAIAIFLNLIAPAWLNLNFLSDFGPFSILIILISSSYIIQKYDLYNAKVIATELAVYSLWFILAVNLGYSSNLTKIILSSIVLALSIVVGRILIISVQHEIKQKEDLAKLAKQLEEANIHLKDLDKLKDDFLSMAAHELNTPLAAIEGYLSMILEEHIGGEVPPKIKNYLESMFTSSKRLSAIIHDMLNVSRIESGRIHLVYVETRIEDVINQSVTEIMSKAKEKKHALVFTKPAKELPKTWFDLTRITEVMINLIGNAIKYTNPGGKIEVSASADEKFITISVKDNGRGIPVDKAKTVFEKFSQVDILKDEVKGTGLGMYIAKKFIELHKGKIWFDSSVGENDHGTTFHFTLPILKEKPFDPHEGEGEVLH